MTELNRDSFTHILVGDVVAAQQRLKNNNNPIHRRELVRAVSAAIEGLLWELKQTLLIHAEELLSPYEYAAMVEESYTVDRRGKVHVTPRFLPLETAIRFIIGIVQRYRPEYKVDLEHCGWTNLKATIEVRNRLVHPKTLEDLNVSDQEIAQTISGFTWFLEGVMHLVA